MQNLLNYGKQCRWPNYLVVVFLLASVPSFAKEYYNFKIPERVYTLPSYLFEISGICYIGDNSIACIQDEDGVVFEYDLSEGKVKKKINFEGSGDFEGIAFNNDIYYVLRSDGTIYEIEDACFRVTSEKYNSKVPCKDNEGLCMLFNKKQILIANKSKNLKDNNKKKKNRFVFAWDIKKKKLEKSPFLEIDNKEVLNMLKKQGVKKKYKSFNPSAIAIHPIYKDIYVLSANDPILLIYSANKRLKKAVALPSKQHAQPEGITFLPNGNMLISNEGRDEKAKIFLYTLKK